MKLIKRLYELDTSDDWIIGYKIFPSYSFHQGESHDGWTIKIMIRIKKWFRFKKKKEQ